jgi:hypothetical protein
MWQSNIKAALIYIMCILMAGASTSCSPTYQWRHDHQIGIGFGQRSLVQGAVVFSGSIKNNGEAIKIPRMYSVTDDDFVGGFRLWTAEEYARLVDGGTVAHQGQLIVSANSETKVYLVQSGKIREKQSGRPWTVNILDVSIKLR